jgi:hypothetical protein
VPLFPGPPRPSPVPVLVLKPLRLKPRRFAPCYHYHFIVPCPYFRALFWPNEFWLSVFLEAGQGAFKTLSGEIWIAALRRWAIARDGRAVEVGPLRLLVVPPGLVKHSFASYDDAEWETNQMRGTHTEVSATLLLT